MSRIDIHRVPEASDRSLPIFTEFDQLADRIRQRAYQFFKHGPAGDGHALDDWLAAEREVCWPNAELTEQDDRFVLRVAMPGFEAADIDVTATPNEIIVKGMQEHQQMQKGNGKLRWTEFRSDDVLRHIELPSPIDVNKASATLKNGLLEIMAPRAQMSANEQTRIEIAAH